jgi:outer membrane lipoprotein-sorting protein
MKLISKKNILTIHIILSIILFSIGCIEENLTAEEIKTKVLDMDSSTSDYSYTMHTTTYYGGQTKEMSYNVLLKKPDKVKSIAISPANQSESISVLDGTNLWGYNPNTNTVKKISLTNISDIKTIDYYNIIKYFFDDANVSLIGKQQLNKKEGYLLKIKPSSSKTYDLIDSTKIWIDQETWLPLKYDTYDKNGTLTMTIQIQDLKVNTGISDSEFVFGIPPGAEIIDSV